MRFVTVFRRVAVDGFLVVLMICWITHHIIRTQSMSTLIIQSELKRVRRKHASSWLRSTIVDVGEKEIDDVVELRVNVVTITASGGWFS